MMNEYTVPPKDIVDSEINRDQSDWIMQYDVIKHLKLLNFEVELSPLSDDLNALKQRIDAFEPHIVFNLIYEFGGEAILDQNVVSYLELLKIPYTGCNPRSLTLARNKATTKKILHFHGIPTPSFAVYPKGHPITHESSLEFPVIVKCLAEEGSIGIFKTSLVHSEEKLVERVVNLHEQFNSDAIVEQFIAGREFSIGILGNSKLQAFPIWELLFENSDAPEQEFYHSHAKWNNSYRRRKGIRTQKAELPQSTVSALTQMGKAVYKALGLNGYARIDFRMTANGDIYVIEANPNPDLSFDEDFAMSAKAAGVPYETLLKRIVSLGLRTAS
jgi:D-alanine-D-alanine ligase